MTTLPRHILHLAEADNWPSIRRRGLLPATELIAGSGATDEEMRRYREDQRAGHITLPDGVQIRDQKPMRASALARCLVGLTPRQWYTEINRRVFFWLDVERLNRQRRACGTRPQMVLTIDAARLVETHSESIYVTPINTGNARRAPATRGLATFVPLTSWLERGWQSEAEGLGTRVRPPSHEPVELTVLGPVLSVEKYLVERTELPAGHPFGASGRSDRSS